MFSYLSVFFKPVQSFFSKPIDSTNMQERGGSNYSTWQMVEKAYMLGSTIVGTAVSYFLSQQLLEQDDSKNLALFIAIGATVGFMISHGHVVQGRVKPVLNRLNEVDEIIKEIESKLERYVGIYDRNVQADVKIAVKQLMTDLSQLTLSEADISDAVPEHIQNKLKLEKLLPEYNKLLAKINNDLSNNDTFARYWLRDREEIKEQFLQGDIDIKINDLKGLSK